MALILALKEFFFFDAGIVLWWKLQLCMQHQGVNGNAHRVTRLARNVSLSRTLAALFYS